MNIVFQSPQVTLYQGDALSVLKQMPSGSVNTCVCSPPYWGLRNYQTAPVVWGSSDCNHVWGYCHELHDVREESSLGKTRTTDRCWGETSRRFSGNHQKHFGGDFCLECGAWRGELGQEPTIKLYIQHLVNVFSEVRRVLTEDGTLWLNLGDSYSGNASAGNKLFGNPEFNQNRPSRAQTLTTAKRVSQGLKPKDLCLLPHKVAIALQEDGWYVRQDIVWSKLNPMPESCKDRPTRSHEYIFLLAKNKHYHYNAEAIAEPCSFNRWGGDKFEPANNSKLNIHDTKGLQRPRSVFNSGTRNCRSVWNISTTPFAEAHFAVFPEEIARRCILAGCPEGGVVLDPFIGSGTTALVAQELGRRALGVELSPEYCLLVAKRCQQTTIWGAML